MKLQSILITTLIISATPLFAEAPPSCFARFVPERDDDFAWENDKVAFRAYGPFYRGKSVNSGIDCWLKRVDYPIINKWYAGNLQGKSYHIDHGEGYDPYHVGSTAGCGGTGLWLHGKRVSLDTFTQWKILNAGKDKTSFMLTYEKAINGVTYREEKTITIELGQQLFDVESVFYQNGKLATDLEICVGLTTHDGQAETFLSKDKHWIATWEKIEGYALGTAVKAAPKAFLKTVEVNAKPKDQSQLFIIMKTNKQGKIKYSAGYGWERTGQFKKASDWTDYLNR